MRLQSLPHFHPWNLRRRRHAPRPILCRLDRENLLATGSFEHVELKLERLFLGGDANITNEHLQNPMTWLFRKSIIFAIAICNMKTGRKGRENAKRKGIVKRKVFASIERVDRRWAVATPRQRTDAWSSEFLPLWLEFEPGLIKERTQAGLAAVHARGRLGGRPRKMNRARLYMAMAALSERESQPGLVAKNLGISTTSLYRYVNPDGTPKELGQRLLNTNASPG